MQPDNRLNERWRELVEAEKRRISIEMSITGRDDYLGRTLRFLAALTISDPVFYPHLLVSVIAISELAVGTEWQAVPGGPFVPASVWDLLTDFVGGDHFRMGDPGEGDWKELADRSTNFLKYLEFNAYGH